MSTTKLDYTQLPSNIYVNVTNPQTGWTGNAYFLGDSITLGAAASSTSLRFSALVSAALGLTENNVGINGQALISNSVYPGVLSGGYSLYDNRAEYVPVYTASTCAFLCIVIGINDLTIYTTGWTSTVFQTYYQELLTYCNATQGWPFSSIIIGTIPYIDPATFQMSFAGCSVLDQPRIDSFNAVIEGLAVSNGTMLADINNIEKNCGGAALMANYLHPTNEGHQIITIAILNGVTFPVQQNGQNLAISGVTEVNSLKFKAFNLLNPQISFPLGVDNDGNVGLLYGIRGGQRIAGDIYYSGAIRPVGIDNEIYPPAGFGTNDILVNQNCRIWGVGSTEGLDQYYFNSIEFLDNGAQMQFYTGFRFIFNDAVGVTKINNGTIELGASGPISSFAQAGDVYLPNGSAIEGTGSYGGYGRLIPQDLDGNTRYRNAYQTGGHIWYTSLGTGGTQQSVMSLFQSGNVKIAANDVTDDGVNLLQLKGNLALKSPGNKISIATGTSASIGVTTLSSGTVTVATTGVTSSSIIMLTYNTTSGTLGYLNAPTATITGGTGFKINSYTSANSLNLSDNSEVNYWVIN